MLSLHVYNPTKRIVLRVVKQPGVKKTGFVGMVLSFRYEGGTGRGELGIPRGLQQSKPEFL